MGCQLHFVSCLIKYGWFYHLKCPMRSLRYYVMYLKSPSATIMITYHHYLQHQNPSHYIYCQFTRLTDSCFSQKESKCLLLKVPVTVWTWKFIIRWIMIAWKPSKSRWEMSNHIAVSSAILNETLGGQLKLQTTTPRDRNENLSK